MGVITAILNFFGNLLGFGKTTIESENAKGAQLAKDNQAALDAQTRAQQAQANAPKTTQELIDNLKKDKV